jgi:hypothetical protein
VFEPIDADLAREFAERAIKVAKEASVDRFLVDVRGAPNVASTSNHYWFAYEDMARFKLEPSSRIAILADPDDSSHDFIATVFLNAGFQCQRFSDEGQALLWLGR